MNLTPQSAHHNRSLVLLAPMGEHPTCFTDVIGDRNVYDSVLAAMQRFRGQVYMSEGNFGPSELSPDGRHVQAVDAKSWHLLTLEEHGAVAACGRLVLHRPDANFDELVVSHSSLAHSQEWGYLLRRVVEEQMQATRRRGMRFAELGGWAVSRELRCSTEAVRLVLAGYALGQILGGVAGISTADAENQSSSILTRIGGVPLAAGDTPFPNFYETQYQRKLKVLYLDSSRPNPRYETHIGECLAALKMVTVISSVPATHARQQTSAHLARNVFTHTVLGTVTKFSSHPA
jgi:Acetyltransferase (GNAT) domain